MEIVNSIYSLIASDPIAIILAYLAIGLFWQAGWMAIRGVMQGDKVVPITWQKIYLELPMWPVDVAHTLGSLVGLTVRLVFYCTALVVTAAFAGFVWLIISASKVFKK